MDVLKEDIPLPDSNVYNITQPSNPLSLTSNQTNVNCHGESTGSVALFVSGGTSGYSYLWSTSQSTSSINNLNAGLYDYLITDANGCTIQDSITITQPDSALRATTSFSPVLCNGGSDDHLV